MLGRTSLSEPGSVLTAAARPCPLPESYAYCRRLARKKAGNFYYTFLTLPAEQFRAMCVLYAYMRICDDLGDDPTHPPAERAQQLDAWQGQLTLALAGGPATHPVFPALAEIVRRHSIPAEYLLAVIDGVRMDLGDVRFATFTDLAHYCYHVAGAVGLCCIHIWGFDDPRALPAAVDCGLAFQLTNILRDLQEDAALGRVYLPEEDFAKFGYTTDELSRGVLNDRFRALMQFEAERARRYYTAARELFAYLQRPGRPILATMLRIYGGLLDEIERRHYDVFSSRVRLSSWRKLSYTLQGWLWPPRG